jgi:hypothetical protein
MIPKSGYWFSGKIITLQCSRVPPLSRGQLNAFLAEEHLSEPLMIIEPEISLRRREPVGGDLRGAVLNGTNAERACAHNRHSDSNRDSNQSLDGWHDHLHPVDERQRPRTANGEH